MFWKKPSPPSPSMASPTQRTSPSIAPRPILKTQPDCGGGPSIRFAGQRVASDDVVFPVRSPAPPPIRVHPPPHDGPHASAGAGSSGSPVVQAPISPQYASFPSSVSGSPAVTPGPLARAGPRRSSRRPTSPSVTSFGARVQQPPQETPSPPMASSSHIQTPPTAYMSRAPPPPSPYRATTASDRRPITPLEPLPMAESSQSQSQLSQLTSRPPRSSSLFDSPNPPRLPPMAGVEVPMLNIIPATPDLGEEFTDEPVRPTERILEEAADLGEDEDMISAQIPAPSPPAQLVSLPSMQAIDLFLEGSFDTLPSDSHSTPHEVEPPLPPAESPPSPPFQSYPSLPSLSSHASMPSCGSEDSMKTSSSVSSLMSFPDVEEALGSMLASLSDPSFPVDTPNVESTPKVAPSNPGLGLGLDLPEPASITPPLSVSPRRRPPPLDLSLSGARFAGAPTQKTAPPCINHRVAFYKTARAHPNSPTSGVLFRTPPGSLTSFATYTISPSSSQTMSTGTGSSHSLSSDEQGYVYRDSISRDSISIGSEASDDDLHTASIISLTPIKATAGIGVALAELREEVGVGMAL